MNLIVYNQMIEFNIKTHFAAMLNEIMIIYPGHDNLNYYIYKYIHDKIQLSSKN